MAALFLLTAVAVWAAAAAVRSLRRGPGRALRAMEPTPGMPAGIGLLGDAVPRQQLPFPFHYLNSRLQRSGIGVTLQTVVLVAASGTVVAWALAAMLVGPGRLALLAIPAGLWAPTLWVDRLAARRREAVSWEMERVAAALAAAVAAGMNAYEALREVAAAGAGPLHTELVRTVADADRVGLSEALTLLGQRLPVPEVRLLIASMRLSQGAGAELAPTLAGLVRTLRDRREAALGLRAATAAGRWQADMLVAIPPLLLFFMRYAYPTFEAPLFATATGQLLLALAAIWLLAGRAVVRRMSLPRET